MSVIDLLRDQLSFNASLVSAGSTDVEPQHEHSTRRSGHGPSLVFIVGHILEGRHQILRRLGHAPNNSYTAAFGENPDMRLHREHSLRALAKAVQEAQDAIVDALESVDLEGLGRPDRPFPIGEGDALGAVRFFVWHETYHVGQLSMLRRDLGYLGLRERVEELSAAS